MSVRYLEADRVVLQASAPAFVEPGHCYWCNKPLTGKATKYCPAVKTQLPYYMTRHDSECAIAFGNYFYQRPAYQRAVFIRDNFTCQECGLHPMIKIKPWLPDMSKLECDHIIPLARGGRTEMSNLQTLCRECNRQKGIKVADDLEQELPRVIPSRDNSKCPHCGAHGYTVLPWEPPEYYDPEMIRVKCHRCGGESYIGPAPLGKIRKRWTG